MTHHVSGRYTCRVSTVNSSATKSGSMLVYGKYGAKLDIIISCIIAINVKPSFVQIDSDSNSPIKSFITWPSLVYKFPGSLSHYDSSTLPCFSRPSGEQIFRIKTAGGTGGPPEQHHSEPHLYSRGKLPKTQYQNSTIH